MAPSGSKRGSRPPAIRSRPPNNHPPPAQSRTKLMVLLLYSIHGYEMEYTFNLYVLICFVVFFLRHGFVIQRNLCCFTKTLLVILPRKQSLSDDVTNYNLIELFPTRKKVAPVILS